MRWSFVCRAAGFSVVFVPTVSSSLSNWEFLWRLGKPFHCNVKQVSEKESFLSTKHKQTFFPVGVYVKIDVSVLLRVCRLLTCWSVCSFIPVVIVCGIVGSWKADGIQSWAETKPGSLSHREPELVWKRTSSSEGRGRGQRSFLCTRLWRGSNIAELQIPKSPTAFSPPLHLYVWLLVTETACLQRVCSVFAARQRRRSLTTWDICLPAQTWMYFLLDVCSEALKHFPYSQCFTQWAYYSTF